MSQDADTYDPIAAALEELVKVFADSSHMWEKYHAVRDAVREGAERVAAAAARLDTVCCPASLTRAPTAARR